MRRKAIPPAINTQFFSDVTPLWVAPGSDQIPQQYREAVLALADWAGPSWSDNEKTGFFLIRQVVVQTCEAWRSYDWHRDRTWIDERRNDLARLRRSRKLAPLLKILPGRDRFKRLKVGFARIFLMNLNIEIPNGLRNGDCVDAFDNSLQYLQRMLDGKDQFPAQFGAIEYDGLPASLPQVEVAIALAMADRITFFRKDGHSRGTLLNPHEPCLSPNLPWLAIAMFASANLETPEEILTGSDVQSRVQSLAKSVSRVRWTP